jgi:hypothetical protein
LPLSKTVNKNFTVDSTQTQPSAAAPGTDVSEAWLFVDSVFPVRVASWEFVTILSGLREQMY